MSVVERFKARRVVAPVVDVPFQGITLKIARISRMELEKAGKVSRKELRDEGLEPENVPQAGLMFARMAALGAILEPHVKGWNIEDVPFHQAALKEFFSEMSAEERAMLGLEYIKAVSNDDEEKKTIDAFLLILGESLKSASPQNSEPQS